jgi:hypothetical protein
MLDYACPICGCAARSYVELLQPIQSKCFRIATCARWYISSRQNHEDLGVPFFEVHTSALIESYYTKLAGVGNPLVHNSADIYADLGATQAAGCASYVIS